jgi:hypothetical protein
MANTVNAAKTHCDHGHEFTEENTYRNRSGYRACRTCKREGARRAQQRRRKEARTKRERAQAKRILGLPPTFWAKTFIAETGHVTPCLIWTGTLNSKGYGVLTQQRKQYYAHRMAYEARHGDIPVGVSPRPVIDHLCRTPSCVNADHLDLVTDKENVLRGRSFAATNAVKTHCIRGHEFTPENTYFEQTGSRVCRECKRLRRRKPVVPAN